MFQDLNTAYDVMKESQDIINKVLAELITRLDYNNSFEVGLMEDMYRLLALNMKAYSCTMSTFNEGLDLQRQMISVPVILPRIFK